MPHVIVHFDPTKVDQDLIDQLKPKLPKIVSTALTNLTNLSGKTQAQEEICVRQQAAHRTDVNLPAIEIEIQAGNADGRDANVAVAQVINGVIATQLIPTVLLELEDCCVWLRFSTNNGFAMFHPDRVK